MELTLPQWTAGYQTSKVLAPIERSDVDVAADRYGRLPIGEATSWTVDYRGKHLVTGEVVEASRIELPLLHNPMGAVRYFVKQFERICKVPGLPARLSPLVKPVVTQRLFVEPVDLFDKRLAKRLGDADVSEFLRAVFVPLIRERSTQQQDRIGGGGERRLSDWRPFQVTRNDRHPTLQTDRTLFNLVPCDRELEVGFCEFAGGESSGVAAMAKNAGPQKLRIDYLSVGNRIAFYVPDFFARGEDGRHYLVETKGREDRDVPVKAAAAVAWCQSASGSGTGWQYLYVPQDVFERFTGQTIGELADACGPALADLLDDVAAADDTTAPLFDYVRARQREQAEAPGETVESFVGDAVAAGLSRGGRRAAEQSLLLLAILSAREESNLATVLHPMLSVLDRSAKAVVVRRLEDQVPPGSAEQDRFYDADLSMLTGGKRKHYERMQQNLAKTLRYDGGTMPIGLLRDCMTLSLEERSLKFNGVLAAAASSFSFAGGRKLLAELGQVYDFRNQHVAHSESFLSDAQLARAELKRWIAMVSRLAGLLKPLISETSMPMSIIPHFPLGTAAAGG